MSAVERTPFGTALRHWRATRRLSQLELALLADTPPRHVSFLETGRSRPSKEMVLRLAEALDVPLSERNAMLSAAGFSASYRQRPLSAAALVGVRVVLERLLASHEPYPALVLDEAYDILDANEAARSLFLDGQAPTPEQRVNLIDLLMGPLRSALVNWHEVMHETRRRLRREAVMAPHEPRLLALLARVELATEGVAAAADLTEDSPVMLTHVRFGGHDLSLLSTLVHFGATRDVTVQGVHVELIYPADERSASVLREMSRVATR